MAFLTKLGSTAPWSKRTGRKPEGTTPGRRKSCPPFPVCRVCAAVFAAGHRWLGVFQAPVPPAPGRVLYADRLFFCPNGTKKEGFPHKETGVALGRPFTVRRKEPHNGKRTIHQNPEADV